MTAPIRTELQRKQFVIMTSDDRYREARRQFDDLKIEDRARFLLEASLSTIAEGLEWAGQELADRIDDSMHRTGADPANGEDGDRPGAAEPETAHRQASPNGGAADTGAQNGSA